MSATIHKTIQGKKIDNSKLKYTIFSDLFNCDADDNINTKSMTIC